MIDVRSRPGAVPRELVNRFKGNYAWLVLTVWGLGFAEVNFHRWSFSALLETIRGDLSLDSTRAGTLVSAYFFTYALTQIPVGILADRFGARRVILVALALLSVGVLTFAFVNDFWTGFASRLLIGLGASAIWVPGLRLMAYWFGPRRYSTVSSAAASSGWLGTSLALLLMPVLASALGWRPAFFLAGLTVPLILAAAYLILINRPEDAGLPSLVPRQTAASAPSGLWKLLISPRVLALNLSVMAAYGTFSGWLAFLTAYGQQTQHLDKVQAGYVASLASIGPIFGFLAAGYLADRCHRPMAVYLTGLASMAVVFPLYAWLSPSAGPLGAGAWTLVVALSVSALIIPYAILTTLVPPQISGLASGLMNGFAFLGNAILPIVVGAIRDATGSLTPAWYFLSLPPLLGVIVALLGQALISRANRTRV